MKITQHIWQVSRIELWHWSFSISKPSSNLDKITINMPTLRSPWMNAIWIFLYFFLHGWLNSTVRWNYLVTDTMIDRLQSRVLWRDTLFTNVIIHTTLSISIRPTRNYVSTRYKWEHIHDFKIDHDNWIGKKKKKNIRVFLWSRAMQ